MSDTFYEMMDWFGVTYAHIGANLESVDEYNRGTFTIELSLNKYLNAKKLGRKMRALHLFLQHNRKIAEKVKERITPQRNENRDWVYPIVENFDYLLDDIDNYARSSTHAKQLKSQLAELREIIQADVQLAGQEIHRFVINNQVEAV